MGVTINVVLIICEPVQPGLLDSNDMCIDDGGLPWPS